MSSNGPTINVPDAPKISYVDFLGQVCANIQGQIEALEKELAQAASSSGNIAQIQELYNNIHEIKQRAESSTSVITEISQDSGALKTINDRFAITGETLRKIDKLIEAVKELETELKAGEFDYYRVLADLLTDVLEQMSAFDSYGAIPHIKLIQTKVTAIETEIKRQVQWSFREIGALMPADAEVNPNTIMNSSNNNDESSLDLENLSQVYLVVDALGPAFRKDLLERFSQLQLIPYEKAFPRGGRYSGLDSLEKRYLWFRTLVRVVEDRLGSVFPRRWCLPRHLFIEFSRRTKRHVSEYLSWLEQQDGARSDASQYVNSLLLALKSILSFEAEMKASFAVYTRGEDLGDHTSSTSGDLSAQQGYESIAEGFDAFLGPYVQLEREGLEELMHRLGREEELAMRSNGEGEESEDGNSTPGGSNNKGPYDSSRQMFEYIKASLKRCTAFSTGVTYLSLSREFRICLHNYAEALKFRCPSPVMAKAGKPPVYVITARQEIAMCRLVSTGEYCVDTIPPLESKMKEHIQAQYRDEVDFSAQIDAFADMVSFTMTVMISGIMERLDPALKSMRKMNWAAVESVGDDSKYVKEMISILSESIVRIRTHMSPVYFQSFCMKLTTAVLDGLLDSIWKLKRVAKTGAGQLLLDLNGIKTFLLNMPRARLSSDVSEDKYNVSKPYSNLVNTRIAKIEVILKLVCTEDDRLEEMFAILWPDASAADHEAVISLKARTNSLLPIPGVVSPALDQVGDILKDGARAVTNTAVGRDISHGLTRGAKTAVGGLKSTIVDFKAVMSGNLFDDGAPSNNSRPAPTQQQQSQQSNTGSTKKAVDDLKNAFGGINAALGFKKSSS